MLLHNCDRVVNIKIASNIILSLFTQELMKSYLKKEEERKLPLGVMSN